MKKIILNILVLFFVLFGISMAEIRHLDLKEFKKEIKNSIVIDIRTPDEVAQGTIVEKPLNIDFYSPTFLDDLKKLDKNKKYLIYCRSGHRSGLALKDMEKLGFKNVADLKGGILAWDEKLFGLPDKKDLVKKYLGKPSLVLIAGTFCPHCQKDVPEVEDKIFNKLGDKINVVVDVVDGQDGARFKTKMNQVFDPKLSFISLTGQDCGYVPSWIVLDKEGNVVASKCGDSSQDGIIKTLKDLGVSFDKVEKVEKQEEKIPNKKIEGEKLPNQTILIFILLVVLIAGGYLFFKKK